MKWLALTVCALVACGDDSGMTLRDGGRSDGGSARDGGARDAGSSAGDSGSRDAGASAEDAGSIDAGSLFDAALPDGGILSVDAGSIDAGRLCGDRLCPTGERCVVECCRPVSMCTWVRAGDSCPEGLMPGDPTRFPCPPIPGVPAEVLCLNGDCAATRERSCQPVPDGECTGPGSTCEVCTDACYGGPAATDPSIVVCRWDS
jgi:hypothetical protein